MKRLAFAFALAAVGSTIAAAQTAKPEPIGEPRATVCRLTEAECAFIVRSKAQARLAAAAQTELSAREHFIQWEDKWIYTIPRHIAFEWQRIRLCELGVRTVMGKPLEC